VEIIHHPDNIVETVDDNILINDINDAPGLLFAYNSSAIIIRRENVAGSFFDLSTGVAGEILQMCSNYNIRLAITGDYSGVESKALRDFIRESNRRGRILFVNTAGEAAGIFAK
jgi:hypothetical protein